MARNQTYPPGRIVAIYYFGALLGAFWAGQFSDKYGRIKGILMACFWCLAGVILQASATNLAFMLCARIVAGVGVAFILVALLSLKLLAASSDGALSLPLSPSRSSS